MTVEQIAQLLAWSTAINLGLLVFSSVFLILLRAPITKIHSKMFQLSDEDLSRAYFQYLAQYKILILVFNLVPYIALRIMGV
jgi:hypothetical protein